MGMYCRMPLSVKPYNPCKDGDKLEGRYCYSAQSKSECSGACLNSLISPNGISAAKLTDSGLIVITTRFGMHRQYYGNAGSNGPYKLQMQEDGNLVIYDKNNAATWASGGGGGKEGPYKLIMQDDNNLVVYDRNGRATWASQSAPQSLIKM